MKRQFLKYLLMLALFQVSLTIFSLEDYFAILNVAPFSTPEAIEQAYEQSNKTDAQNKAFKTLQKADMYRYHIYQLLVNGAEGRKPALYGDNQRLARKLVYDFMQALHDIGSRVSIIDSNSTIEKAYEKQKKLLKQFNTGSQLKDKLEALEKAYIILTEPWRLKDYVTVQS